MPRRFMLDIETLALTADAVVWCAAITEFAQNGGEPIMSSQMFMLTNQPGRHRNSDTISWTMAHGDKELYEQWRDNKTTRHLSPAELYTALEKTFGAYGSGNYEIWAKGAKFDFAVMQSYFSDYGLATPWHYRAERDMRTLQSVLKSLGASDEVLDYDKPLIPHNAFYDTVAQAQTVARWINYIEKLNLTGKGAENA